MPRENATRLVVFDCDGTLVDSQHHIVATMEEAFAAIGQAPPAPARVRHVIGLSLGEAIAQLWPEGGAEDLARVEAAYRAAFFARRQRPDHDEPLYQGARECIELLEARGYLLGIATGKARRGLDATLGRHGLLERFVTLQTADRAPGKPDPTMLEWAMREAGAEPSSTLLIGDTSYDMEMARNAKVTAIGVSWGYHPPEVLARCGAHAVLDSFDALAPLAADLLGGAR
ncbi:MAG: HAD-IA family hydrolase [Alphaproteobacteria bacterium]|nr:HAD-IA family hydrolase [Alphaproteobacteria bacterium]